MKAKEKRLRKHQANIEFKRAHKLHGRNEPCIAFKSWRKYDNRFAWSIEICDATSLVASISPEDVRFLRKLTPLEIAEETVLGNKLLRLREMRQKRGLPPPSVHYFAGGLSGF